MTTQSELPFNPEESLDSIAELQRHVDACADRVEGLKESAKTAKEELSFARSRLRVAIRDASERMAKGREQYQAKVAYFGGGGAHQ